MLDTYCSQSSGNSPPASDNYYCRPSVDRDSVQCTAFPIPLSKECQWAQELKQQQQHPRIRTAEDIETLPISKLPDFLHRLNDLMASGVDGLSRAKDCVSRGLRSAQGRAVFHIVEHQRRIMQQADDVLDLAEILGWDIQPDRQSVGYLVPDAFRWQRADIFSWSANNLYPVSCVCELLEFCETEISYRA